MGVLRIFALAACGQSATSENQEEIQSAVQKTDEQSEAPQNGAVAEQLESGENSRIQKWKWGCLNPFRQRNRRQMWI